MRRDTRLLWKCRGLRQLAAWLPAFCLALGLALALPVAAWSQALSDAERAELQLKKAALFEQLLRDPSNLDTTFAYADVSAKLGDNEAAVAALERMLLFNPNLPRVDLELGALYFRMGSFETARSYFDKANVANPPDEVKNRIAEYEAQIATRESGSSVTGSYFFGVQYQSDANVAPGSPLIHSPIGDVLLSQQFVKQSDANIFGAATVLYSYDLGTQNQDTFEVGATAFGNHYFNINHFDLALGEVTVGPRFHYTDPNIAGATAATLKPYLIANEVGLGWNQYFHTFGVGMEETADLPDDLYFRGLFEYRQKNFANAPDRPQSTGLNGSDKLLSLTFNKLLTENSAAGLQFDYLNQSTQFTYFGNDTVSAALSYKIRYPDPFGLVPYPLETIAFGSRSYGYYDSPDPCCNTSGTSTAHFSTRFDRRWRFGVTETMQITPTFAVIAQLQRDIVSSNLPIYAYTANSALVGMQIRF